MHPQCHRHGSSHFWIFQISTKKNLPRDYVLICPGTDFSVLLILEGVLLI
mgnify:FL=1